MPRCVGLRDLERLLDVADAELAVREKRDYPQSRLVSQRLKEARDRADIEDRCWTR